jgi:protease I
MKKILFIIAHEGFRAEEYNVPKKILEGADIKVVTASDRDGAAVSSVDRQKAGVDLVLENVNVADYDGIFIIGGPGASQYLENEQVYRIAREVAASGKIFGAICYSTRILAHAGVLKGRKATGWNKDDELPKILLAVGAEYMPDPAYVDGNLITANGPAAAEEWGRKILEKL